MNTTAVTLHSNRGLVPLPFQHCPRFHCKVIALKSRTFVVKSRTKFPRKFVRGLNAKPPIVPSPLRRCLASTPREQLPENRFHVASGPLNSVRDLSTNTPRNPRFECSIPNARTKIRDLSAA
jgi:hypothetical protein